MTANKISRTITEHITMLKSRRMLMKNEEVTALTKNILSQKMYVFAELKLKICVSLKIF